MSETLSDEARKEMDNYYKNRELPACSKCGTNESVIPTVRGKPSHNLMLYAQEGHVKLSGCTQSYSGWCKKCQEWIN